MRKEKHGIRESLFYKCNIWIYQYIEKEKWWIEMVQIFIPTFMCPHCDTKCSFSGMGIGDSVVLYCQGCRKGVYFRFEGYNFEGGDDLVHVDAQRVADYYPRKVLTIDKTIPPEIGDDFNEANNCLGVGAKKATVAMCRRALQNACVSKGADQDAELWKQIDELESKRIINPSMKEVAHAIRVIGNWGAHPQVDPLRNVTLDDASEIANFTSEFLDEVFVRPDRLEALKRKKNIK
jgi:hypothetical protein